MNDEQIKYFFSLAGGISYSGDTRYSMTNTQLRKFVTLLLEAEREACAEVAFKTSLSDLTPGAIADAVRGRNG